MEFVGGPEGRRSLLLRNGWPVSLRGATPTISPLFGQAFVLNTNLAAIRQSALTRRVQVWVLPHLPLHFLTFFIVMEHDLAITKVTPFDTPLCFLEEGHIAGKFALDASGLAPLFECFRFLGSIPG